MTGPSEAAFQSWLVDCARLHGWMVFYVPDWTSRLIADDMRRRRVRRDWADAGWPDVALVHPDRGRFVLLECKSRSWAVRAEQKAWLDALRGAGVDARVVRPKDADEIERLLTGREGDDRG